jgi:hypothetical protein
MLQSIKSWLVQTGYLTRQQLAEAEEYREAVGCSLPRALWSLRAMHPRPSLLASARQISGSAQPEGAGCSSIPST